MATSLFTGSQNPVVESGFWHNEGPGAFGNVQKVSGVAQATAQATHCAARYIGEVLESEQYSEITDVNANAADTNILGVSTRMQSNTDGSCYALYYKKNTTVVTLYKVTDTGTLNFASPLAEWSITPADNISLRLESIGFRHKCFYQENLLGIVWNGDLIGGQPGIVFYNNSATLSDSTIGAWEGGNLTAVAYGLPGPKQKPPNYTTFPVPEDPLSENNAWTTVDYDQSDARHWFDQLKIVEGAKVTGKDGTNHHANRRSGTFQNNQYAAALVDAGVWAGITTRQKQNGDCYLAFIFNATLYLFYYDHANDAEGFHEITNVPSTGNVVLIEAWSEGDSHKIYMTVTSGGIEQARVLAIDETDARYPTGGSPGAAVAQNGVFIYEWWEVR